MLLSFGMLSVRDLGMFTLALRLEAAGLLDIQAEEGPDCKIALFGIPSLDTLNRKYGVVWIDQPNRYLPYYGYGYPLPSEDFKPPVEDVKKDRNLRTFYVNFSASTNIDKLYC